MAEPRLLALRLHGFKSFAERTTIEFGRGISAIVGPNGSGKSNLADALRWALGEQGRALRSRKAEDVIWAGSEKRAAQGMADVTLVIDNADGLLPVEFQVLELGRRLYRSGENDYLLNKSRVRLRDLVDLLDAAHLADNAFLFIGQGMVDQALALRPEERRPLFDEVAGVRRHERRRRHAEEQLVESEANLARVEDILAELRPQARRLAAQAEQQASRETHGRRARGGAARVDARTLVRGRRSASPRRPRRATGLAATSIGCWPSSAVAEAAASALARELAARTAVERERREAHDAAQASCHGSPAPRGPADLGDRGARARAAALDATSGPPQRPSWPPRGVPSRRRSRHVTSISTRRSATPSASWRAPWRSWPSCAVRTRPMDRSWRRSVGRRPLARPRSTPLVDGWPRWSDGPPRKREQAALRQPRRRAELDLALGAARGDAWRRPRKRSAGRRSSTRRPASGQPRRGGQGRRRRAAGRLGVTLAAARARLSALESRLAEEEARGIARAARRLGGHRLDEDLVIAPELRAAAEAALAEATRAYVVEADAVAALAGERGSLVVAERAAPGAAAEDARERRFRERLSASGGGVLDAAVRRDPLGAARRLLARCAWLPDLAACLAVQSALPPGWVAVPRDGSAVVTDVGVSFGAAESVLERRAEAGRLEAEVTALEADLAGRREDAGRAAAAATDASAAVEAARADESRSSAARRSAEEAERLAARQLEAVVRESAWHEAQAERLAARARAGASDGRGALDVRFAGEPIRTVPTADARQPPIARHRQRGSRARPSFGRAAIGWREEARASDAARREAEHRRARAEASAQLAEERMARADRDMAALGARERALGRGARRAPGRDGLRGRARAGGARGARRDPRRRCGGPRATGAWPNARPPRLAIGSGRRRAAASGRSRGSRGAAGTRRPARGRDRRAGRARTAGALAAPGADGRDRRSPHTVGRAADGRRSGPVGRGGGPRGGAGRRAPRSGPSRVAHRTGRRRARPGSASSVGASTSSAPSTRTRSTSTRRSRPAGDASRARRRDLHTAIARTRDLIGELDALISDRFQTTFRALETAFARGSSSSSAAGSRACR